MPDWLVVIVLGIVEGITEFLPISSTGHLLLTAYFLPNGAPWLRNEMFIVVIQSAAVLAILPLFRHRFAQLRNWQAPGTRDYFAKVVVAFAITGIGGVLLKAFGYELPETPMPIACALLVGGIFFVIVENWLRGSVRAEDITWQIAVAIGLAQLVAAVFPGASRSGTTVIAALLMGLSRPAAIEFSFIVSVPTMLAAGALEIFGELRSGGADQKWMLVLLGAIVSAIVSFIAVKWLLRFVQSHTFIGFGWYRIVAGLLLLFLVAK